MNINCSVYFAFTSHSQEYVFFANGLSTKYNSMIRKFPVDATIRVIKIFKDFSKNTTDQPTVQS